MQQWFINGRFLTQPISGVQRYAREVLNAIDTNRADASSSTRQPPVKLLVPPDASDIPPLKTIAVRKTGHLTGHLWEQLDLPRAARGPLLSLANTGPLAKRHHIVCIHDANTRLRPDSYALAFRAAYRALHPVLGHTAAHITTVSNFSAQQLAHFGIARENKITVCYNGADHARAWRPTHTTATAAVASPGTIVTIGSAAPHKNIGLLIALADRLAERGLRLAVVGMTKTSVFANSTHHLAHPAITCLGRIDDNALAALLQNSLCLAFPSRTEGFGLPPVEAMIHRCPVVATPLASLPEVCGNAALYADADDPDAWLTAFESLRDNPALRTTQIAHGERQAAQFTWSKTATTYIDLIHDMQKATNPTDRNAKPQPAFVQAQIRDD